MTLHGKIVKVQGKIYVEFCGKLYPATANAKRYVGRSVTAPKGGFYWDVNGTKATVYSSGIPEDLNGVDELQHAESCPAGCDACMTEVLRPLGFDTSARGLDSGSAWSVAMFILKDEDEYRGEGLYLLDEEENSSATWAIVRRWDAPGCVGHDWQGCRESDHFNDRIEYVEVNGRRVQNFTPDEIRDAIIALRAEGVL
jgi:hypothetical protein